MHPSLHNRYIHTLNFKLSPTLSIVQLHSHIYTIKMEKRTTNIPSLISRDASTAIKGLLMLLIVFGHTGMITTDFATGERTFFWHWLYSFHVYIFLILPFIYGYHRKDATETPLEGEGKYVDIKQVINDLKHNLVKIGVPYCFCYCWGAV